MAATNKKRGSLVFSLLDLQKDDQVWARGTSKRPQRLNPWEEGAAVLALAAFVVRSAVSGVPSQSKQPLKLQAHLLTPRIDLTKRRGETPSQIGQRILDLWGYLRVRLPV